LESVELTNTKPLVSLNETMVLTQEKAITLYKATLSNDVRTTGECLRNLNVISGPLYAQYQSDLYFEARWLCRIIGAPNHWIADLVNAVFSQGVITMDGQTLTNEQRSGFYPGKETLLNDNGKLYTCKCGSTAFIMIKRLYYRCRECNRCVDRRRD
jgi:hypothetical protein